MARDNGVGISEETITKQEQFRNIIVPHMRIVKSILQRNARFYPKYVFVDMNAGRGYYPGTDFLYGSPLVAIQSSQHTGIDAKFFFIEKHSDNAEFLRNHIQSTYQEIDFTIINQDHNSGIRLVIDWLSDKDPAYGLVYNDPTGTSPSYGALNEFAESEKFIDLLIYVSATNIKRKAKYDPHHLCLKDGLASVDKKEWRIREPRTAHQWTFVIGTNWKGFPAFKGLGMHDINSQKGQLILDRLNLRRDEFERKHCGRQLALFDIQRIPPASIIQGGESSIHEGRQLRLPTLREGKGHRNTSHQIPRVGNI